MTRNYYVILGVDDRATLQEIKSAYREQVKRFHPDHYGADSAPFLEIQEAYEVLSDPGRRDAYDAKLLNERARPAVQDAQSRRAARGRSSFAPSSSFAGLDELSDLLFDLSYGMPIRSFEDLFQRLWDDLAGRPPAPAVCDDQLAVEISLTQRQAMRGGQVRLSLPVRLKCPDCLGLGCRYCLHSGVVEEQIRVEIAFPAGITHAYTQKVQLRNRGLPVSHLKVHFQIVR
jgi:DnaJ-class molecular chaperone